jgi:thiol-disulfide isomerase/thioredoxin
MATSTASTTSEALVSSTTPIVPTTTSPGASIPVVRPTVTPSTSAATKPQPTPTTSSLGWKAPELVRPTGFTNIESLGLLSTEEFTLGKYIGKKVILLEFWTTSSVSSIRTLPYLNRWHALYAKDGLLVVAVHTPQFAYERSKTVVDKVAAARGMTYPIVLDNGYTTWSAYKNKVWPYRYLIDIDGRVVHERAGDASFEATEARIAELLTLRAKRLGVPFTPASFAVPKDAFVTDTAKLGSGEAFFGSTRNSPLLGGVALKEGIQNFSTPTMLPLNTLAPVGSWNFTKEYAQGMTEASSLQYRYKAKDVFGTFSGEKLMRVKVLRDGAPVPESAAGEDLRFEKGESVFYVKDARVYEIVTDQTGYGEHTIELIPDSGGLVAYSLMFG